MASRWFLSLALCALLGGFALAGTVDDLVRDLGNEDFKVREAATAELSKMGPEAVPALEKAARDKDAEIRWRARKALDAIRARGGAPAGAEPAEPRREERRPAEEPRPPQLVPDAIERARRQLKAIEEEMARQRPELGQLWRMLRRSEMFQGDLGRILEEFERRFRDLERDGGPAEAPGQRDFWSFRFKDGRWELIRPGDPVADKVGVRTQPVPPVLRAQLRLAEGEEGVVIEDVTSGGLAAKAGILRWDLVLSIDGGPVHAAGDIERLLAPGEHTVVLVRGGERVEMKAAGPAVAAPDPPKAAAEPPPAPPAPPPGEQPERRSY